MLLLRRDNTQHTVLHPHMPPSSANIDTRKSAIRMFKRHGQGQRIASMSMHNTTVSVFMPLNMKWIFLLVFFCTECGSGFSDIYPLGSMVGVTKNLKLPSPSLCLVGSGPVGQLHNSCWLLVMFISGLLSVTLTLTNIVTEGMRGDR